MIHGRLKLPGSAASAASRKPRGGQDTGDAVVYVTQPPQAKGKKLNRKAVPETVELVRSGFAPRVMPIVAGSEVKFENLDQIYHNVFSVSPKRSFDLGKLSPGASAGIRFDSTGVVHLFCELHPAAAGFVLVCPNRIFARVGPTGDYVLPALPRGPYIVNVWHPRFGSTRRSVEVTGRGEISLDLKY